MGDTLLMRQAGEPSVEEILESIKKVIARDSRAEAAQQVAQRERAQRPGPPASTAEPEPVLELTDAEPEMDEDETDKHDFDIHAAAAECVHEEPAVAGEDAAEPLVAETAVSSMRDSLAALALLSQPGAAPQIVRSGETSLEGLTRDLLRPMLAQWLETNLPAMVERLVSAEIARIARKKS